MVKSDRIQSGLQLPYLETFAKAAELASFTKAAEFLGMTQAGVSQHVRALERELSSALFRRRAGRVELTDAGRTLHEYARRILELHAEARVALGQTTQSVRGELRIAASTIPAEHFLTGLLQRFHEQHSHVHVIAEVGDSVSVVGWLEKGRVSLGLVGRRIDAPWAEYQLFAKDRLALVVPTGHAWNRLPAVTLEDLRNEPLIVREPGSGTRACLERALAVKDMALADLNVNMELGSNEAIKDAVWRGLGVSFLSSRSVKNDVASAKLSEVPMEGLDLSRELFIVTDRRRAIPPHARSFIQFLSSVGAELTEPSSQPDSELG